MTRVDWRRIVAAAEPLDVALYDRVDLSPHEPRRKLPPQQRAAVARAYAAGDDLVADIARRFGVGVDAVRAYAREAA